MHPLTPPPPASDFPPYEPRDFFRYEVLHQSKVSSARVGRIHTPHGAKNPTSIHLGFGLIIHWDGWDGNVR